MEPAAKTIALLINPNIANAEHDAATVQEAGRAISVQILVTRAVAENDFETVFATLARERAGALLVNRDVFFTGRRDQLVEVDDVDSPSRGISVFEIPIPGSGGATASVGARSGSSVVVWIDDEGSK